MTETTEGHVAFRDYRTWYRITGSLESAKLPLVVAHGGPGCTHDYVDAFKDIAALDGRAVIHYDQLGNGNSTRLPDKGPDFWTVDLFLDELDTLLRASGHREALCLPRPVLGRHARRRACGAQAGRPQGAGDRQFAGQHAHLGGGGQPAAPRAARRTCRRR